MPIPLFLTFQFPTDHDRKQTNRGSAQDSTLLKFVLPWTCVALIGATYVVLWVTSRAGHGIIPAWSDELVYVASARSFAANGAVHEAILANESTAKLWGLGSHGFVYIVLDGLLELLPGGIMAAKPAANALMLLGAAGILAATAWRRQSWRVATMLVMLGTSLVVPVYLNSYMQESLQMLIAAALWSCLAFADRVSSTRRPVAAFAVIALVAALARPTWVFALIGLWPFCSTRKQRVAFAVSMVLAIGLVAVSIPFLHAPYPFGFLPKAIAIAQQEGIWGFAGRVVRNFWVNLVRYFGQTPGSSGSYLAYKYFSLSVVCAATCLGIARRDRLAYGAGLMGFAQYLVLCLFYDAYAWREQRVLAPFAVMAALSLCLSCSQRSLLLVAAASCVIWAGGILTDGRTMIKSRRQFAQMWRQSADQAAEIKRIADSIDAEGISTVLLPADSFSRPNLLLALPVRSKIGAPIRYTINLSGDAYERRGRIPVKYALADACLSIPETEVLLTTSQYKLLRFRE